MTNPIILLSDGSWAGYSPDQITIMEITDEGLRLLCEGAEIDDLEAEHIVSEVALDTLLKEAP